MDSVPTAHGTVPQLPNDSNTKQTEVCTSRAKCKPKSKIYYLLLNQLFTCCHVKRRNLGAFTFLKRLHVDWFKSAESRNMMLQRCGVTVISLRAWMRASSGGCVLKREDSVPLPKSGLTMQSAEVDGESAVVGIRWL